MTKNKGSQKQARNNDENYMPVLLLPVRGVSETAKEVLVHGAAFILSTLASTQEGRNEDEELWKSGKEPADVYLARNKKPGFRDGGNKAFPKALFIRAPKPDETGMATVGEDVRVHVSGAEILLTEGKRQELEDHDDLRMCQRVLFPELNSLFAELASSDEPREVGPRFSMSRPHPDMPKARKRRLRIRSSDVILMNQEIRMAAAAFLHLLPDIHLEDGTVLENLDGTPIRESGEHIQVLEQGLGLTERLLEREAKVRPKRPKRRREVPEAQVAAEIEAAAEKATEEVTPEAQVAAEEVPEVIPEAALAECIPKSRWHRLADKVDWVEEQVVRAVCLPIRLLWRLFGWRD